MFSDLHMGISNRELKPESQQARLVPLQQRHLKQRIETAITIGDQSRFKWPVHLKQRIETIGCLSSPTGTMLYPHLKQRIETPTRRSVHSTHS